MMQTRKKLDEILQEIETPEKKSGKQIGERILGKKLDEKNMAASRVSLEIEQLKEYVEQNNQHYAVTLESGGGESSSFIKRLYRKVLFRLLAPVLEQETVFHASVTRSINHLYNNMIMLQQFIDAQANQIQTMEKKLEQQEFYNIANEEKIRELYQRLEQSK